jgi:peptide/nickel transport system substrate-binding protein
MRVKAGIACVLLGASSGLLLPGRASPDPEELLVSSSARGHRGGRLTVALRAEPKTLNPLTAMDLPSREVIGRMHADLISINRQTQLTQPALAKSWTVSPDGRRYTLHLRRGLRFSDGHAFDADDVVFTFEAFLDEKTHSPQRDLLIIDGHPVTARKIDAYTVVVELPAPYAAAERIFDGVPILPRHILEKSFREGKLADTWRLNTPADSISGLGPFRLKQYEPGERLVLERNPYFWQEDSSRQRLPYFDELSFLFVGSEEAQVTRFAAGETDILNRVSPRTFPLLAAGQTSRGDLVADAGPSLEYNFLVFNLSPPDVVKAPEIAARQAWFQQTAFRKAASLAVDRDAIVRLVYGGRGAPMWGNVSEGNQLWSSTSIPKPDRSISQARDLLASAGFKWDSEKNLHDRAGKLVEFSIAVAASNTERVQMATIVQDDLKQLGMKVQVASLEFRSLVDRVLNTRQFDAAVMGLGGGDADPNSEMNVWLSSGGMHLWNPGQNQPATPWEAEIDRLMHAQMSAVRVKQRKQLYDRVQQVIGENIPMVFLASPHVVVAARKSVGNFTPAVMADCTLWNVAELFRREN